MLFNIYRTSQAKNLLAFSQSPALYIKEIHNTGNSSIEMYSLAGVVLLLDPPQLIAPPGSAAPGPPQLMVGAVVAGVLNAPSRSARAAYLSLIAEKEVCSAGCDGAAPGVPLDV